MEVVEGEEEEDGREDKVAEEGREEEAKERVHGSTTTAMNNLYRRSRDGIRNQRHECLVKERVQEENQPTHLTGRFRRGEGEEKGRREWEREEAREGERRGRIRSRRKSSKQLDSRFVGVRLGNEDVEENSREGPRGGCRRNGQQRRPAKRFKLEDRRVAFEELRRKKDAS